jgi:plasmid replication initiation protein
MYDFKKRILDLAITQINTHTDITAIYEQHKRGRVITGFSFTFKQKSVSKETKKINIEALLQDESWVSKHSQIGESWEQARARLRQEAKTGKFTLSPTI